MSSEQSSAPLYDLFQKKYRLQEEKRELGWYIYPRRLLWLLGSCLSVAVGYSAGPDAGLIWLAFFAIGLLINEWLTKAKSRRLFDVLLDLQDIEIEIRIYGT